MEFYKIKDVVVAEVFSISRNDNLIDLLIYEDALLLVKKDDRYYDLFSHKEFLQKGNDHYVDDVFYIKKLDELIYYDFLTNKELISGLVSEERLRLFSNKVNSGIKIRKRSYR